MALEIEMALEHFDAKHTARTSIKATFVVKLCRSAEKVFRTVVNDINRV